MEQIKIVDARTLPEEVRRQKQIEQLERMIVMRSERAQSTERYLRIFGSLLCEDRLRLLKLHLYRTIESIIDMRRDLIALQSPSAITDI